MREPLQVYSIYLQSIDAGADYLELDYPNAGIGVFANTFKNSYIFTFSAPVALQITDVLIDPSTTLGLTPDILNKSKNLTAQH